MTELQGTRASTEDISTTGKKVLNENTGVTDYEGKKGANRTEALKKYANSKDPKDAEAARKAGATQTELKQAKDEVKESKPSLKGIFNSMLNENDQITIQPAKQNTQVIKQGQKTLGTVENPQLANQIKQSIGKGEMTLAGGEKLGETEDDSKKAYGVRYKVFAGREGRITTKEYWTTSAEKLEKAVAKIEAMDNFYEIDAYSSPDSGINESVNEKGIKKDLDSGMSIDAIIGKYANKNTSNTDEIRKVIQKLKWNDRMNSKKVDETDMGQADARKSTPSSKEEQEKVFSKSRERARNLRAELDADPEFLTRKNTKKVDESMVTEKSVSKSQQQAAGAALAAKRGDAPKSKLKGASKEMAKMSTKELKKFAGTKHKGLPDKKEKTDEAAMPTHDGDFTGLGVGRNSKTLESKKAKPDFLDLDKDGNKKESMKKAAADKQKVSTMKKTNEAKAKPDYIDLDKDGNKTEPMKKAAADKKKKTVKEGANPTEAARLLGKAHALGKDPFACKYEQGSPEAQAYLDGYKEGLDECYGSGGDTDMSQDTTQDIGMMPGMDSMVSITDTQSPRGGSEFEVDSMDDMGSFGGFDDQPDEADMMAFEAWDRQLNELLNEGKMKEIDTDMQELSDVAFKKAHGKSKAEMEKALTGTLAKKDKKPVKEGISVSVSKGQQGAPDSVSVTAQDGDADALLAMIKQAGLGLFGGEEQSGYGAPTTPQMPTNGAGDIGDHDSMMSLIKKMTTGSNDYEDEESGDDQHVHGHPDAACDVCGSSDCGCDDESDSKALVVGEEETEDQMEFEVAEANAPDSDQAETTADENAEAEEDKALAGADSDKEEEIDEGSCSDEEEELTEWANDAGYEGSENTKDNTFEEDIDFMTRVISGGLNGPKKDQTTLPHTKVTVDDVSESILDWKKLSGIK